MPKKLIFTVGLSARLKIWSKDQAKHSFIKQVFAEVTGKLRKLTAMAPGKSRAVTLQTAVGEEIRKALAANPVEISCSKGCYYCCHQFVTCNSDEAKLVADHVKKTGMVIDMERLAEQAKHSILSFDALPQETARCVFLGKDGACGIYEVRPSICRAVLVTSDPMNCKAWKNIDVHFMPAVDMLVSAGWNLDGDGVRSLSSRLMEELNS